MDSPTDTQSLPEGSDIQLRRALKKIIFLESLTASY